MRRGYLGVMKQAVLLLLATALVSASITAPASARKGDDQGKAREQMNSGKVLSLREIEGLSYEEIAELMNCPIGTVRSRIFRAREAIALRLRPLLDTREGERW